MASQFYFLFRFSRAHSFRKVETYLHTKFRRNISIHSWGITTFVFWNFTSRFNFHVCVTIGVSFCICLQISSKSDHPWQSYGVISSIQDGGHIVAILLPVSVFVSSLIWEGRSLPAYQILVRYLNPRLRHYYFRFLKTNVRHVEILFPVEIVAFASPSPCYSASKINKYCNTHCNCIWQHDEGDLRRCINQSNWSRQFYCHAVIIIDTS